MDWEVHDHTLVVDPRTIETIIHGRDPTSGDYWELRITSKAMQDRWGARGQQKKELKQTFEKNRDKILAAACQKFKAGQVESLNDRVLIRLDG